MSAASGGLLRRLAADAAPAVFPAIGAGARERVEALRLRPLRLVSSPRHATLLLVAGGIPPGHQEALERVHDQLPHPRATLYWGAEAPVPGLVGGRASGTAPEHVAEDDDPLPALLRLHRHGLLAGETEGHQRPDEPPAPWRGLGDHGQGGEGMMGGTPYGRPMAMTDDDIRDGLALDRLSFTLGPFFPPFPPGLVLRLALQGDLVQEVEVLEPPFAQPTPPTAEDALRRLSRVLRVAGAAALADRALRVALEPDADGFRSLRRWLIGGSGLRVLPPVPLGAGATVRSLARARLDRAGGVLVAPGSAPGNGPADEPLTAASDLPRLLSGLEWGEAILAVASLRLASEGGA